MWKGIINFVLWIVQRFITKRDAPQAKYERAKNSVDNELTKHDEAAINRRVDDLTDRLP